MRTKSEKVGGRPQTEVGRMRSELMARLGISYYNPARELPRVLVEQVQGCADDAARRLLLGVSRRGAGKVA